MITDAVTVFRKEWKEIVSGAGGRGRISILIVVLVFGFLLPLQLGRTWAESPVLLAYWAWVPMFLVISVIADSFAGERERHTLETLLASRLPDQAILVGKIAAAMAYGVGITWVSLVLGTVTVTLSHGHGHFIIFPALHLGGIIGLSLLGSALAACVGVLVSLRAETVRQAQQTLSIVMLVLLFALLFGFRALPVTWRSDALRFLSSAHLAAVLAIVLAAFVVADAALFAVALARFRRSRLVTG
jgi:ABC-2 type transport system permease protein